jgi:hypothetical protein
MSRALRRPVRAIRIAFESQRHTQPARRKPGTSFTTIRSFRNRLPTAVTRIERFGARLFSYHDLNQSHDMDRIEKVHTDNCFGTFADRAISLIDSDEVLLAKINCAIR